MITPQVRRLLRSAQPGLDSARELAPVARRRLSLLTGTGWTLLAVSVVALVTGRSLGWGEFTLVGVIGLLTMVFAGYFVIRKPSVELRLQANPPRVTAGEQVELVVDIVPSGRNDGARYLIEVALPQADKPWQFEVEASRSKPPDPRLHTEPTFQRGVLVLGPAACVRMDPLGLLRRVAGRTPAEEVLVHPPTVELGRVGTGLLRDLEGRAIDRASMSDIDFHALRLYVPGDDPRHIHWVSSARTGGDLMIRQFDDTRLSRMVVIVSGSGAEYADRVEFELAMSAAGSLAIHAARTGQDIELISADRTATGQRDYQLLDSLARSRFRARGTSLHQLAAKARSSSQHASLAVLIVGSGVDESYGRQAAALLGVGIEVLVIHVRAGAEPNVSRIARTTSLTLGSLAELPTLLYEAARR